MAILVFNIGIFLCLVAQLDSIARHNRQGSKFTKHRDNAAIVCLTWYAGRGVIPFNATLRVSQLLGHERAEVTNGYLVSVPKGGSAHA